MSDPLRSPEDYELYLYSISQRFPSVRQSTLTLVRKGASLARVAGELLFDNEIRLVVRERILYDRLPAVINWYGYEVWQGGKKLYRYDSQPHPNEPSLQNNHPHHKHVLPDLKHNRVPTPELSFARPNLNYLIQEIETLTQKE